MQIPRRHGVSTHIESVGLPILLTVITLKAIIERSNKCIRTILLDLINGVSLCLNKRKAVNITSIKLAIAHARMIDAKGEFQFRK